MKQENKYRILWIGNGDERYGVGSAILNLMLLMRDRGHDARLLTIKSGYLDEYARNQGITTYRLDGIDSFRPFGGSPLSQLTAMVHNKRNARRTVQSALQKLQGWQTQVVHSQWPTHVQLAGMLAQRLNARAIWEMPNIVNRDIPLDLAWRYYTHLNRKYNITVLSNSAYTGRTIASKYVEPTVFHLGVDERRFDKNNVKAVTRKSLNIPEDAFLLGVAARICASKGQDRIVEAVSGLIRKGNRNLHLLLMGSPVEGEFADLLRQTAVQYGANNHLHMVGSVEHPERFYATLDLSINFRIDPEPFGLSVVESMMMGVPVIVHNLGGPGETVIDGETGLHVDRPTSDALSTAISNAYQNRTEWRKRSSQISQYALNHFGRDASYNRYIEVLENPVSTDRQSTE